MKRLSFDHIHQDKMFQFSNDYDPDKLIEQLVDSCKILADLYRLDFKYSEKVYFEYEIKHSDIYRLIELYFKNDELDLDFTFEVLVPNIQNSFCNIAGVRRYIQKQIRDKIYIRYKVETKQRLICEFSKTFTLYHQSNYKKFLFNVQGLSHTCGVATYLYLLEEGKDPKLWDLNNPVIENCLNEYQGLSKDELLKIMNPNVSNSQKKRLVEYVRSYWYLSRLLQEYFESPSDILFGLFSTIDQTDTELGLNLQERRLRTIMEMIHSNFMSKIVDYILEAIYILNKKKRTKIVKLEPFQGLYEFVLVENMFEAPLASVANRSRVTIAGEGGFSKDGIPTRVKDLHPTQFNCLDPAVTPDRENAGVVLYLSTTCEVDELGRFKIDKEFVNKVQQKLLGGSYE